MGVYNYAYTYTSAYNKKMFFRIMQTDNTPTSYSVVRVVDGSDKNISGMHIFPSLLTDKMAIQFNKQDNRKITLYSMTGKPVWSNTYMNTATIRIALPPDLKKGIYIVEAVNIKNSEREVSRIVIQ